MKGVIFTKFLELVEERFSRDVSERIVAVMSDVPVTEGYSALGNYGHQELLAMVARLSSVTGVPEQELLRSFGAHLFDRFVALYPVFFVGVDSAIDFMSKIETYIHGEVKKLYPDAELPSFECTRPGPGRLVMLYRSHRPLADLAEGMIRGCAAHFGEEVELRREDLESEDGQAVRFSLTTLQ